MKTRHSANEKFANFKSFFLAFVTKQSSNGASLEMPETLTAWLLIHYANIGSSQHLGVMPAAASEVLRTGLKLRSGKDDILKSIKYERVASVV